MSPETLVKEQVCFTVPIGKEFDQLNISGSGGYGYLMEWLWWTGLLTS